MSRVDPPAHLLRSVLVVGALAALAIAPGVLVGCGVDPGDQTTNADDAPPHQDTGIDDDSGENDSPNGDDDAGDGNDGERPDENSGQQWDWGDEDFAIEAVIPARGSVDGGTEIQVTGDELSDGTELFFGDQFVESELSQGQLIASTPPADTTGPVTVRAISASGEESTLSNGFTYADDVVIDDVTPADLPTTGGIEIDITGSGFTDPMGVSFSSTPARQIDVINDGLVRVIVPRMSRGFADLHLSIPDAADRLEDALYFFDPLDIETIEPAAGSTQGQESVTLTGDGITADTAVTIGGQNAGVQSVNVADGTITVLTPSTDTTGAVDVTVETERDIQYLSEAFVYDDDTAPDGLYGVQPPSADIDGGTEHIVSGRGLDASNAAVFVGGQSADIVESGPAHARIVAPSVSAPTSADVTVEHGGTEVDRLHEAIHYVSTPEIDVVSPATGTVDGGDTVIIEGSGLGAVDRVLLDSISASFEVIDDTEISVTTPASEPGIVDVIVETGSRQTVSDDAFSYVSDLDIWSMHPSRGSVAGNTWVTVRGRGLLEPIDVEVGGQSASDIQRQDPYTVTFRTPPSSASGGQPVSIESMGRQAEPGYPFVYFNPTSSFGGAYGPSVDGAVNVSVLNFDGTPVAGAFVMLSNHFDTPFRGYTDAQGRITLSGPGVLGPQTIHATAADMSTVTVRDLNARNITLIVNPLEPESGDPGQIPPPPMAHFEGTVSIVGKQPNPEGAGDFNMSRVRTTRSAIGAYSLNPGPGSLVAGGEGQYEIRSDVGDLALVAFCGYYDEETDHFTPKMMAVERNLSVSDGQRPTVDLICDIPLDQSLPVQISDPIYAPDGPTANRITPYLDFGFEGVITMPHSTTGLSSILYAENLPAPEGKLDNISYSVVAGSYTNGGLPYSQTTLEDIPDVGQVQTTSGLVGIPELLDPIAGGVVGDHIWIGRKGTNAPDMHYLVFNNSMGLPAWTFIVPGDDQFIPMPEFPSFSELPEDQRPAPYQSDPVYSTAYGIQIDGFDYNAFTWADLQPGAWSAFSVASWNVSLTD